MKRILALAILSFSFVFSAQAQLKQTPVFSKVTATWCPRCGTWGWDFMEEMKDMYNNGSEAVILGVHYSGNLQNPTAEWFADNLNPIGQPVFFINNTDQNVSTNWTGKIPTIQSDIETLNAEEPVQALSFASAYINENNEIVANVTKSASSFDGSSEYYFGVYVFENNVEETQSPRGASSHPNVLRDVMSNNFWGDLVSDNTTEITEEYTMALNDNWDANNVGLVGILWRKSGSSYIFENSSVVYNVGLLSSAYELIDDAIVDVKSLATEITVSIDADEDYNVSLVNPLGQIVSQNRLYRNLSINTSNLVTGIYTLHISQGNQIMTKQVFVNN